MSYQESLYDQLENKKSGGVNNLNKALLFLIFISLLFSIAETEILLHEGYRQACNTIEVVLASIFAIEYLIRLWAVGADQRYKGFLGRIKYIFTFYALIDLLAFLPSLIFFGVNDAFIVKLFRVFKALRVLKVGRYSKSFRILEITLKNQLPELTITLLIALTVLVIAAYSLYLAEGIVQPEAFGSVPRALWWAVITLTTVGYGDVYPVTVMGKAITGVVALTGVAMVAMPAGILASGFTEAHSQLKNESKTNS